MNFLKLFQMQADKNVGHVIDHLLKIYQNSGFFVFDNTEVKLSLAKRHGFNIKTERSSPVL